MAISRIRSLVPLSVAISTAVLASACHLVDLPRVGDRSDGNSAPRRPIENAEEMGLHARLFGTWQSGCEPAFGSAGWEPGARRRLELRADGFRAVVTEFSDRECATPWRTLAFEGTFLVVERAVDGASVGQDLLSFAVTDARMALLDPLEAGAASQYRQCGIGNWRVGEERSVSGTLCALTWIGSDPEFVFELEGESLLREISTASSTEFARQP